MFKEFLGLSLKGEPWFTHFSGGKAVGLGRSLKNSSRNEGIRGSIGGLCQRPGPSSYTAELLCSVHSSLHKTAADSVLEAYAQSMALRGLLFPAVTPCWWALNCLDSPRRLSKHPPPRSACTQSWMRLPPRALQCTELFCGEHLSH